MYEELISHLRECAKYDKFENTFEEAADTIEYLSSYFKYYCPHYIQNVHDGDDKSLCAFWGCDVKSLPQWIPVTERLPDDNEAVNVVWVNHNPVFYYQHIKDKPQTSTGVYYRGQWYWWSAVTQDYLAEYGKWEPDLMDSAIEVTHWMPLPEPPQESNQ